MRSLGTVIEAAFTIKWYVTVALSTVAMLILALPSLRKPPPPPPIADDEAFAEPLVAPPPSPSLCAAGLPSPRRAAHEPAAESGLCPRERRPLPVVVALWEEPQTACAAARQPSSPAASRFGSGAPDHRRVALF